MKACKSCKTFQVESNFYAHKSTVDKLFTTCKSCCNATDAARKRDYSTPARVSSKMKYNYGITLDDYNCMYKLQLGVCMICNQAETNGKRLAIDHDHSTGKVRGLLCNHCNIGLGKFFDNPQLLQSAINYINDHLR
jgi:hypothetical protein